MTALGPALPVEVPPEIGKIRKVGLGFEYVPTDDSGGSLGVLLRADYIHMRSDTCSAQIEVEAPLGVHLRSDTFNLMADRTRASFAKSLHEANPRPNDFWRVLLEEFALNVLRFARPRPKVEKASATKPLKFHPTYLVEKLLIQGEPNTIYAQEQSAKSILSMQMAVSVASGQGFGGLSVIQGPILYCDWEAHKETFDRRVWMLSAGMGLAEPPVQNLNYMRLQGSLQRNLNVVMEEVDRLGAVLVVLDSVALASGSAGDRGSYEDKALELMEGVEQIIGPSRGRTVLMIDQVNASGRGSDELAGKSYGSIMKQYLIRYGWELRPRRTFGEPNVLYVDLHHAKFSEGALLSAPLSFAIDFTEEGAIRVDWSSTETQPAATLIQRVVDYITYKGEPQDTKTLAAVCHSTDNQVRNLLRNYPDRVTRSPDARIGLVGYQAMPSPDTASDTKGTATNGLMHEDSGLRLVPPPGMLSASEEEDFFR